MKNNKGFTLVELLAVIVLLAVITTIAVPSIMGISRKTKEQMLETKIDLALEEAKLYGQDNISDIAGSTKTITLESVSYPCINIKPIGLIQRGYLKEDDNATAECSFFNPIDNSCIQNKTIILYVKNKRVVAIMADADFDRTNENSCS